MVIKMEIDPWSFLLWFGRVCLHGDVWPQPECEGSFVLSTNRGRMPATAKSTKPHCLSHSEGTKETCPSLLRDQNSTRPRADSSNDWHKENIQCMMQGWPLCFNMSFLFVKSLKTMITFIIREWGSCASKLSFLGRCVRTGRANKEQKKKDLLNKTATFWSTGRLCLKNVQWCKHSCLIKSVASERTVCR